MSRLGVGLVGAGWMGTALLRRLSERDDVEVVALCEADLDRGREVLDELRLAGARLTGDYDALLADSRVEAVFIVSPNVYHGAQSIAALDAGKHVFCEKPPTTTYREHMAQLAAARAHPDLCTFVDYILYFDTFEQRLRKMVAEGTFGTITQIQVNYRHPVNIAGEKAWKLKQAIMGDAIGMGINHAVSVLLMAMAGQARPVRVFATSMAAQVRPFEADPIWNIQIAFDNGAAGFVFGNIDSSNGYDAYHSLCGTRGGLVFDSLLDREQKVRLWSEALAGGRWVYPLDAGRCARDGVAPWPADTTTPDSGDVLAHQTAACVGHFVECVRRGQPSPLSVVNAAGVAEIGWAARMSAEFGQPVPLPIDEKRASGLLV